MSYADEFIKKAIAKFGNKYDYSKVQYVNSYTEVIIVCPVHGESRQSPKNHLAGKGCPKCAFSNLTSDKDTFIQRARAKHGDEYDYSLVEYINSYTPVKIICPEHGVFEQAPCDHIRSNRNSGCNKCYYKSRTLTLEQFIEAANKAHNNKYNYSKVQYINYTTPVTIICPTHGEFKQTPSGHIRGKGCVECGHQSSADSHLSNTAEFIDKARAVHGNLYDYSKTQYIGVKDKVEIICPEHGTFRQAPNSHLNGQGCPICPTVVSVGHQEVVDYIKSISNVGIVINDRQMIAPSELDIYIPNMRLAIEYHGIWYHSYGSKETPKQRNKHRQKYMDCKEHNIRLIQIYEYEWKRKGDIIRSKLLYLFGKSTRIPARACSVRELDVGQYNDFMNNSHIQGAVHAPVRLGLFCNNELVAAASMSPISGGYELMRFANKLNCTVVGGMGKLLVHFDRLYNKPMLLSYADIRYSDGNLYNKLGFRLDGLTEPNYHYVDGAKIYSRIKFQKHKLPELLEKFDPNMTEAENMFANSYRRLWDAGSFRFIRGTNEEFAGNSQGQNTEQPV